MSFLLNDLSLVSKYAPVSTLTSSVKPNLFHWSILLRSPNSQWSQGPDLENWMGVKASRGVIHLVLPSLQSTCDTVYCLGERTLFFLHKNSFLLWNSCKQCSESSTHCCFDLTWANVEPTLNIAFSLTNIQMMNTLPSDIFNYSAISRNFNLRSAKTNLWSFLVISRTTVEFGWPERSASFVSARPRLKTAYHILTVVSDRAESE